MDRATGAGELSITVGAGRRSESVGRKGGRQRRTVAVYLAGQNRGLPRSFPRTALGADHPVRTLRIGFVASTALTGAGRRSERWPERRAAVTHGRGTLGMGPGLAGLALGS